MITVVERFAVGLPLGVPSQIAPSLRPFASVPVSQVFRPLALLSTLLVVSCGALATPMTPAVQAAPLSVRTVAVGGFADILTGIQGGGWNSRLS